MATYRNIQLSFWTDSKVSDNFTPEDKYFYLYLLTNPHTNTCGCYELSIRQMSIETGYSKDTIEKLILRMESTHNVIRYENQYNEVLILHWSKYNWTSSPKLKKSIEVSIRKIKTPDFKAFLTDCYENIDTLSIGYQYPIKSTFSLGSCLGIGSISKNINKEINNKAEHNKDVDDMFEKLWKLYIRKEGKNQVNKKSKEEIFNIGYDRMKASIEKYTREKQGVEKQYLLMGSTFFNGRYKDYLEDKKEPVKEITEDEWTDEEFFKAVDSGFGEE